MSRAPLILETTLRDGSYTIDFQFTAADTEMICEALDTAGFPLIEVGHGIGLGASEAGGGVAAETDEGYMRAAAKSVTKGRWGMFCIPGIATLDHVDMAIEHGMGFLRVGTNVDDAAAAEPFIERAKTAGMFVAANFMKSYALTPSQFAETAALAESYGADVLYIVDSAGGMLPAETVEYCKAVHDRCGIEIGFHGHNNLGLAVANSLCALESGAAIIDTSLQGLGRSAGNTPTEVFLLVLDRIGLASSIDPFLVMDIGERLVRPLIQKLGYDSIDVISGYAQFHSSYMGLIRTYSGRWGVDPRRLIAAVAAENKIEATSGMVDRIAQQIAEESHEAFPARYRLDRFHGAEQILAEERAPLVPTK